MSNRCSDVMVIHEVQVVYEPRTYGVVCILCSDSIFIHWFVQSQIERLMTFQYKVIIKLVKLYV